MKTKDRAEILGQETALTLLRRSLAGDRLPQALLFQGPEGVGKETVARWLAAVLLCELETDGAPCGTCISCRKLESGNHPDFFLVTRLPKKGGAAEPGSDEEEVEEERAGGQLRSFITVDQIRDVIEHSSYGPQEARRRVFVVDPADRMNGAAQNALLKTLEEPQSRAVFLLISARPHLLLPTVRSRCLAVRFAPMLPETLAPLLEARGFSKEEAKTRAALAGGCPGLALKLDLESTRERRDGMLTDLEALVSTPRSIAELSSMAARLAGDDEDDLLSGLEMLEGLVRDGSRASLGSATLIHVDRADRLAALGNRLGPERGAAIVRSIAQLRGDVTRFHFSRALVAESVLAAIAGGPLP